MKTTPKVKQIAANCLVISTVEGEYLQSYNSIICLHKFDGTMVFDVKFWDYSATTRKHRSNFTGLTAKQIKEGLGSGLYKLEDLNN